MIALFRLSKLYFAKQNKRSGRPLVEIPALGSNQTTNRTYD